MAARKETAQKADQSAKPYNSETLDDIRQKIDALDDRIHDTLMERAALVLKIGEEKRRKNIQIVQPAREARMIRRLLTRHEGALPKMAVVRIWRELVGAVSLLQTGLKAIVTAPEGQNELWDLARDYFGSCLPMQRSGTAQSAMAALKDGRVTFAVVPWPELENDQPWWAFLGGEGADVMKIIISLPHGLDPANPNPDHRGLVVAKAGFDDSGADNSFLLIQCEPTISRGRLVDMAKKSGLVPLGLFSKRTQNSGLPVFHLMEVEDYIAGDDQRLADFIAAIDDPGANAVCVGGYPVPPSYAKSVTAAVEKA